MVAEWLTPIGDLVEVYEITVSGRDEYRWRVVASNGEKLAQGEGHTTARWATKAALRYHPPVAPLEAVSPDPTAQLSEVARRARERYHMTAYGRPPATGAWENLPEQVRRAWREAVQVARRG